MRGVKAKTVDEYLGALSKDKRTALEQLRRDIHAAAPGSEECISYSMPAVRWKGKVLVWFGASRSHCAFYPGAVVQSFAKELADYKTAKGTIRFAPEQRLPATLVKKLVKARMATLGETGAR